MRNKVDKETGIPMDTINSPQFIDRVLTHYGELWRYHLSTVDKWVICWAKANANLENINLFKESISCNVHQWASDFMIRLHLDDYDPNTHHLFIYDKCGSNDKENSLYDALHNDIAYVPAKQFNEECESFNTEHIIINRYNRKGISYDEHIS